MKVTFWKKDWDKRMSRRIMEEKQRDTEESLKEGMVTQKNSYRNFENES